MFKKVRTMLSFPPSTGAIGGEAPNLRGDAVDKFLGFKGFEDHVYERRKHHDEEEKENGV